MDLFNYLQNITLLEVLLLTIASLLTFKTTHLLARAKPLGLFNYIESVTIIIRNHLVYIIIIFLFVLIYFFGPYFHSSLIETPDMSYNPQSLEFLFPLGIALIVSAVVGWKMGKNILTNVDREVKLLKYMHEEKDTKLDILVRNISKSLREKDTKSIEVTGGWGTGKSFAVAKIIQEIEEPKSNNTNSKLSDSDETNPKLNDSNDTNPNLNERVIYISLLGEIDYVSLSNTIKNKLALEIWKVTGVNVNWNLKNFV